MSLPCYVYETDRPVGLAIPGNSLAFNQELSRSLATAASHLTLEFLKEWTIGFSKAEITQKIASLQYVQPWLANLDTFSRPSRETGIESIKQIEEIVRSLAAITVAERRVRWLRTTWLLVELTGTSACILPFKRTSGRFCTIATNH